MKKYFCMLFILFFTTLLFAHPPIQENSYFTIMEELDLTTAPMWVDTGEWIKKHTKYWIFLPDSRQIFDYEEDYFFCSYYTLEYETLFSKT